jgi:peroxiredoxin
LGVYSWAIKSAAVLAVAGVTVACSGGGGEGVSSQMSDTGDQGYVSGDGSSLSISPSKRTDPVKYSGVDEQGNKVSDADTLGSVTVVNFWYAGCAPCRAEAPDLVKSYDALTDQDVKFLGVNTRDQAAQAKEFAEEFSIPYDSILDTAGDRSVQRAFAGQIPLNAVPTTLVLDTKGRVAHRVLGQLADSSQLKTLVRETLEENGS